MNCMAIKVVLDLFEKIILDSYRSPWIDEREIESRERQKRGERDRREKILFLSFSLSFFFSLFFLFLFFFSMAEQGRKGQFVVLGRKTDGGSRRPMAMGQRTGGKDCR